VQGVGAQDSRENIALGAGLRRFGHCGLVGFVGRNWRSWLGLCRCLRRAELAPPLPGTARRSGRMLA
jgi:hypothetical protein